MNMFKSIVVTTLIVCSVWGVVWAQQTLTPKVSVEKKKQFLPITTSLVGLSATSSFAEAENTAFNLMTQLTDDPALNNQLKNNTTLKVYLIYQYTASDTLLISSAMAEEDLKHSVLKSVVVPRGKYDAFAAPSDSGDALIQAWQNIDMKRQLHAVIESYQFNMQGALISAQSFIAYQPK